ncbi:hypothetical protein K0M31_001135 [Melipona bicolor]|uniref:Uncharacterized protein n=1 Tax=Melipona bicolor TaxID=60889 RepID=A0AA40GF29_9HYME|nr:hypothetical protein K0M31_001135 [Melipona bicolor]
MRVTPKKQVRGNIEERRRGKKEERKIKERSEKKQEEKERSVVENTEENHLYTGLKEKKDGHMAPAVREGSAPRSVIIASGRGN